MAGVSEHAGWIKLYRQSLDSEVWANAHLWQFWCYCLLRANHKQGWVSVKTGKGDTQVRVEPGQFIFGRFAAANKLKAKPTTIYNRLKRLEKAGNVVTQNKVHYTLVTVCNWAVYQNHEHPLDTHLTPTGHPIDTDNNGNNEKNPPCMQVSVDWKLDDCRDAAVMVGMTEDAGERFFHHYVAQGWKWGNGELMTPPLQSALLRWKLKGERFRKSGGGVESKGAMEILAEGDWPT